MAKKDQRFVGIVFPVDLADRIGTAAQRQGRTFREEVIARLTPFYYPKSDISQ